MKARGFLSLDLVLIIAAIAAVTGAGWWLYHLGASNSDASWEKVVANERAARRELISGLALDLAGQRVQLAEERRQHEDDRRAIEQTYKDRLHEYVPKTADSASCLRAGFVRYTDAAAAGVPLGPGPEPAVANAPSDVATDVAASVIADNYALYHACEDRVKDLLREFDSIRAGVNGTVDKINRRVKAPP